MKILFIGGTHFVGRNIVEKALEGGHQIFLVQRGKTNANLFDQRVSKYFGDRMCIENLIPKDEYFDLVVDCCGYHPDQVSKSAHYLKDKTKKYVFISTGSVYADFSIDGLNELSDVLDSEELISASSAITHENYGLLKSRCESTLKSIFHGKNVLILRPCIIVGKYDETKRFNLLLEKIQEASELILPNDPMAHIQFIDVRAIADFVLNSTHLYGTFNLIGPSEPITLINFILRAKSILNPELKLIFADSNEIEFPMYVSDPKFRGFFRFDGSKAYNAGLKKYTSEETIQFVSSLDKEENT